VLSGSRRPWRGRTTRLGGARTSSSPEAGTAAPALAGRAVAGIPADRVAAWDRRRSLRTPRAGYSSRRKAITQPSSPDVTALTTSRHFPGGGEIVHGEVQEPGPCPVRVEGDLHPAGAGHLPLRQARHRSVVGGAPEERLIPSVGPLRARRQAPRPERALWPSFSPLVLVDECRRWRWSSRPRRLRLRQPR
jgi:hypothetical protein